MELFKKHLPSNIDADECEHIIGIVLSNRKSLISFSQIAADNIDAGIVIGQAFATNVTALDDEFDALALFYCWKFLISIGATENSFIEGASLVFDNFDIDEEMRKLYSARLEDYSGRTDFEIGTKLLGNIASIYSGQPEDKKPQLFAKQLADFNKLLRKNIHNELSA